MDILSFKKIVLYPDVYMCFLENDEIKLTKKEYNLLHFLLSNVNKVFTRKEIIDAVWQKPVKSTSVDILVSRVRKKLYPYSYITTQGNFGYGILDKEAIRERCLGN